MFVSRRICTFRRPCNLAKSALPGAQSKARSQQGAESGQQWLNLSRQISWNRSIMFARLPSQATFKHFNSMKIISKVPQSLENTVKCSHVIASFKTEMVCLVCLSLSIYVL
jgi:hypothetical protein